MIKKHNLYIFFGLLIGYFFLVNFIGIAVDIFSFSLVGKNESFNPGAEVVGVGDRISVQKTSQRWYGTTTGTYSNRGTMENFYLFNFLKIPTKIKDINIVPLNFMFLFFAITVFIVSLFWR